MSFHKEILVHKSRKPHVCEFCCSKIDVGELYYKETGSTQHDFYDYCLCDRCRSAVFYFCSSEDDDIGTFSDHLYANDFFQCSKCHSINTQVITFNEKCTKAHCLCKNCENKFTVNLGKEVFV